MPSSSRHCVSRLLTKHTTSLRDKLIPLTGVIRPVGLFATRQLSRHPHQFQPKSTASHGLDWFDDEDSRGHCGGASGCKSTPSESDKKFVGRTLPREDHHCGHTALPVASSPQTRTGNSFNNPVLERSQDNIERSRSVNSSLLEFIGHDGVQKSNNEVAKGRGMWLPSVNHPQEIPGTDDSTCDWNPCDASSNYHE